MVTKKTMAAEVTAAIVKPSRPLNIQNAIHGRKLKNIPIEKALLPFLIGVNIGEILSCVNGKPNPVAAGIAGDFTEDKVGNRRVTISCVHPRQIRLDKIAAYV
jgi:hypothetical protein